MNKVFARRLLCAIAFFCVGAGSALAENGFDWDNMTSRFATDFSEAEAACRAAAAEDRHDPLTHSAAAELCPKLQRMLRAGECRSVNEDMRGQRHDLMTFKSRQGVISARQGARVRLSFRPEALQCDVGFVDGHKFIVTVYVGQKPNGEQACYNVAVDFVPVRVRRVCWPEQYNSPSQMDTNSFTPGITLPGCNDCCGGGTHLGGTFSTLDGTETQNSGGTYCEWVAY